MRGTRVVTILSVGLAGALVASLAAADVQIQRSTKTKGATTVSWNSSFVYDGFDCLPITLTEGDLDIVVDSGDAALVGFLGRKHVFTPPNDVTGSYVAAETFFTVEVNSLHFDEDRGLWIVNVHLKMRMEVDKDGVPGREASADFGVNLHLESASDCS
ncbi:MAG: hypothetical protein ACE5JH_07160 [Acidobacteriota bacterium]